MRATTAKYWACFSAGPIDIPVRLATRDFVKAQAMCNEMADQAGIAVELRLVNGAQYGMVMCEPLEHMLAAIDTEQVMTDFQNMVDNLTQQLPPTGDIQYGDPMSLKALCLQEKGKGNGDDSTNQ